MYFHRKKSPILNVHGEIKAKMNHKRNHQLQLKFHPYNPMNGQQLMVAMNGQQLRVVAMNGCQPISREREIRLFLSFSNHIHREKIAKKFYCLLISLYLVSSEQLYNTYTVIWFQIIVIVDFNAALVECEEKVFFSMLTGI